MLVFGALEALCCKGSEFSSNLQIWRFVCVEGLYLSDPAYCRVVCIVGGFMGLST